MATNSNPCSAYPTDALLFAGLKRNDEQAYACLYAQTFRSFAHYVYNTQGSLSDAEDAFQQGIADFYVALDANRYQLSPTARIKSVLFEFCKRKWLNERQSARFRRTLFLEPDLDRAEENLIDELMTLSANVEKLRKHLAQLGENCRRVVEMFYLEDQSLQQIAEALSYTAQTARTKRYECTERLKRLFFGT